MTHSSLRFTADENDVVMHCPNVATTILTPVQVCLRFNAYSAALRISERLEARIGEGYALLTGEHGIYKGLSAETAAQLLNDQIELLNELKG